MSTHLSRRTFTRGSLGALAAAALGGPLLAGCSNEGRGADAVIQGDGQFPTYIRYQGAKPDLPGTDTGIPDGFFQYPAEPVKAFKQPPGDGKPISAIAQTSEPIPPAVGDNAYWQELNKRLGSALEMQMTPATEYSSKFATIVAGNQLPDIFQVARGATQVPQMMQATALDLSEYLAGDAVADYPMLANIPTESWRHCMFGGKLYAVPIPRGVLQSTIQYARKDLLDELGISPELNSFTDYFELCKELTRPSSNIWALTQVPHNFIKQMLKVPNVWREEGGKLTYNAEVEECVEALEASRKLVEAGVIIPDAFAVDASQYKEWLLSGRCYISGDSYSAWPSYNARATGDDAFELTALDLPGFHGGEGSMWLRSPTHSIVGINKEAADRAETLLSVMNWLAAPFGTEEYTFRKYGVEGVHYTLEGTDPAPVQDRLGETFMGIQYLADAPRALYLPGAANVVQTQYDHMTEFVPGGTPDPTEGLYSETDTRVGGKLGDKLDSVTTDIILGRRPVSDWKPAVEDWRKSGGDKIRTELEQALQQQ